MKSSTKTPTGMYIKVIMFQSSLTGVKQLSFTSSIIAPDSLTIPQYLNPLEVGGGWPMVKARVLLNYHAVSFHQTCLKSFSCCVKIVVYPLKHFFLLNKKKKNKIMLPIRFFPDFKRKQASHIIQTVSPKKKKKLKTLNLHFKEFYNLWRKSIPCNFIKDALHVWSVCLWLFNKTKNKGNSWRRKRKQLQFD